MWLSLAVLTIIAVQIMDLFRDQMKKLRKEEMISGQVLCQILLQFTRQQTKISAYFVLVKAFASCTMFSPHFQAHLLS